MARTIEKNVGNALTKIEFKDSDGALLGWLEINLIDERFIGRLAGFAQYFRSYKEEGNDVKRERNLNQTVKERFSELLGYQCDETLFGRLNPLTVLENGETFIGVIMRTITQEFIDEARRRMAAKTAAIRKHTEKYEHDSV